jgi:hypothetical protein
MEGKGKAPLRLIFEGMHTLFCQLHLVSASLHFHFTCNTSLAYTPNFIL